MTRGSAVAIGAALAGTFAATAAHAQRVADTLPFRRGQWSVEFPIDDPNAIGFMRFRSTTSALVIRPRILFKGVARGPDERYFNWRSREKTSEIGAHVGRRSYRGLPGNAAGLLTVGVIPAWRWTLEESQVDGDKSGHTTNLLSLGAFVEAGADYFITPHLSIGARTELTASYRFTYYAGSRRYWIRGYTLSKTPATIVAALYF